MVKTDYSQKLRDYLADNGYAPDSIFQNNYTYKRSRYPRIEIKSDNYVIQAFILMSSRERERILSSQNENGGSARYPFYRSYEQQNPFGIVVNPACAIAVLEDDSGKEEWHFYSASDLFSEYNLHSFINYNLAKERFDNRFGKATFSKIKRVLYTSIVFLLLYFILHMLSANGLIGKAIIPFNSAIIILYMVVAFVILLPMLLPYIDSLSLPGVSLGIKKKKE